MPAREQRIAENEAIFRAANERMAAWTERHDRDTRERYVCECADPDCHEQIELLESEYEWVREDPVRFMVVAGHEIPDVETVVERRADWVIVAKEGETRAIAEATDPRGRS